MDICSVVRQGKYRDGNPVRHKCQFSYYCDGKPERPAEKEAWTTAQDLATLLTTTEVEVVGLEDATHYHAVWVQPSWTTALKRKTKDWRTYLLCTKIENAHTAAGSTNFCTKWTGSPFITAPPATGRRPGQVPN